ncbi:MAG: hypothetical protein EAX96_11990 [Candidatus Lokiarchaeota archaeon]|nr:hypothetical protein [Candidatus Lokiarchaeota archaeon]
MISIIFENLSKIFLVIGLVSIFLKIILVKRNYDQISEKKKLIIYNIHKASFSLSTIFAFIHGFTFVPINRTYIITGWLFGIVMIVLFLIGIKLGFQNNWKPYNEEENSKYKKIRALKWILTLLLMIFLVMHYFL